MLSASNLNPASSRRAMARAKGCQKVVHLDAVILVMGLVEVTVRAKACQKAVRPVAAILVASLVVMMVKARVR